VFQTENEIRLELEKHKYHINRNDLKDVLNQLYEDKYVNREMSGDDSRTEPGKYFTYKSTWAGKYFQMTSGYQKKIDSENAREAEILRQNTLQTRLQTKLNRLTFWIAFGTLIAAAYYLKELYVYFFP